MPRLIVSELEADCLSEAYPLIRCLAGVEPGQWTCFAEHLLAQGGGVFVARAEDGSVHGVAGYVVSNSLKHGRALRIEVLAAIELGHTPLVREALHSAVDDLARRMACSVVLYNLDAKGLLSPRSTRRRSLEQAGLSPESIAFVRRLAGTHPPS
jgi:hypothetical protein